MSLKLTQFGGVMPKVHPEKLGDTLAQTAQNVNLTRGVIEPISVESPFAAVYSGGELESQIPSADFKTITKPDPPSVMETWVETIGLSYIIHRGIEPICRPVYGGWLKVMARTWVEYTEDSGGNGVHVVTCIDEQECTPKNLAHTEAGVTFDIEMEPFEYTFARKRGDPYVVYGPLYQFVLSAGNTTGGPEDAVSLPSGVSHYDPEIPGGVAELMHEGQIYAIFQVVGVAGPKYSRTVKSDEYDEVTLSFPPDDQAPVASFAIKLNYVDPSRKTYYYLQTLVTDDDEEGPPSEISERITLRPGEQVHLDVPLPDYAGYTKHNLYRSATGQDDFLLLEEMTDSDESYTDYNDPLTNTPLPVYGNAPTEIDDYFLPGSVIHPAQFAAAMYGDHLYLSDYYRFWVWPEEYAIPFQDTIDAIALVGGTIVVWVDGKVFGVSGNNPEAMSKSLISDAHPLLAVSTIAMVNGGVVYATNDGLAFCDGSGVQILTKDHYTRTQWMDLAPDEYTAKVADNSVFLDKSGAGLRVDLDEDVARVTTYTSLTATTATWKSKAFHFEDKTIFDYARIVATGSVTLKVYAEGSLAGTYTVTSETPVALTGLSYARKWEFEVETTGIVREMEFFDRQVVPIEGTGIVLRQTDQLYGLRRVRLLFPEIGSFSVLRVAARDYTGMTAKLYVAGVLQQTVSVTSDAEIKLSESLPNAREWEFELSRSDAAYEVHLIGRMHYPVENGLLRIQREGETFTWRDKRIMSSVPVRFSCGRVLASAYPVTVALYHGETAVATISAASEAPFRLPMTRPERLWRLDVIPTVSGTFVHQVEMGTSMEKLRG